MAAALYFAGAGAHYHSCAPVLSSCPLLAPLLFLFEPPWPSRAEPMLLVILKHYPSPSIPISLVVPVFSHLVYLILQPQFLCAPLLQAQLFWGEITQPMRNISSHTLQKAVCFLSHCGLCLSPNWGKVRGILCSCLFLGRVQVSQPNNLHGSCPALISYATFSCISAFLSQVPSPWSFGGLFQTSLALPM